MPLTPGERREAGQIVDAVGRPVFVAVEANADALEFEHEEAGRPVDADGRDVIAIDMSRLPVGSGELTPVSIAAGDTAESIALDGPLEIKVGARTANLALTFTDLTDGATAVILGTQDATGSRDLTINGATIPIQSAANAPFTVDVNTDGTDLWVTVRGGTSGSSSASLSFVGSPDVETSDFALLSEDTNKVVDSATSIFCTVPDDLTPGRYYPFWNYGSATLTLIEDTPGSITSIGGLKGIAAGGFAQLFVRAAGDYHLSGDLVAGETPVFNWVSFSPLLWVPASSLSGLALTSSLASVVNEGSQADLVQATGANQPTVQEVTNNGDTFRVIRADGGDFMSVAAFAQPAEWTMMCALKVTGNLTGTHGVLSTDQASGTDRHAQFRMGINSLQAIAFSATANATDSQAATMNAWNIVEAVRTATTIEVFVNGVSGGSTAIAGTPRTPTVPLLLGVAAPGSNLLTGDVAFPFYAPSAMSAGHRLAARTELAGLTGVTL